MARLLEPTNIEGPAGRLEALHEGPEDGVAVVRAAVICHPHPLHGGTMHNKVVFRLARAARESGAAVLRFNFRGVGASAGSYDSGKGEQEDLRAALDYMSQRYPGLPLAGAGFSFGAGVGLRLCCNMPGVERFVAAGTAVNLGDWAFLERCPCPKFFVHSTTDQFGSRPKMESVFASAAAPKKLIWIEAVDHFFSNALDALEEAAYRAMSAEIPPV
jgi:hypothetical protein